MKETQGRKCFVFPWAQRLSAVAARMEPRARPPGAAGEAAAELAQAMKDTKDEHMLNALTPLAQGGLSAVAGRAWSPRERARPGRRPSRASFAVLTQAIKDPKNATALYFPGRRACRRWPLGMEPKESRPGRRRTHPGHKGSPRTQLALYPLGARAWSAVAARMEPKEAAQAAAVLTQVMKDPKDARALNELAPALSAVAARMEPKEAARSPPPYSLRP